MRTIAALLASAVVAGEAAAQTMGPVTVQLGFGPTMQTERQFAAVGPHIWGAMETVLDRRLRIRVDAAFHHFDYKGVAEAACPPDRYCAPPLRSDLDLIAVTGTVLWRDTTGARPWYAFAGLGAYGVLHLRDGNSRAGLTGGVGRELLGNWFAEVRAHYAYDATGYRGFVVPVVVGRRVGRFVP